jgi:hypothetical protein
MGHAANYRAPAKASRRPQCRPSSPAAGSMGIAVTLPDVEDISFGSSKCLVFWQLEMPSDHEFCFD